MPLVWVVLVGNILLFAGACFYQIILGKRFGNHPAPDWVLFSSFLLSILLMVIFLMMRVEVTIDKDKITYTSLLFNRQRHINWTAVKAVTYYQYTTLGYGVRYDLKRKAKVYNLNASIAVLFAFNDGSNIGFGTNRYKEIRDYIRTLNIEHIQINDEIA